MRLLVKNKFFTLGGSSIVTDENGEIVYKVKGSVFSNIITHLHKKVIRDKNRKKLFVVRNKFWHKPFYKSALIYKDRKKLAKVVKSHFIKNGYDVIGATEPIKVEGSGWNLEILLGDRKIGHISLPAIDSAKSALRVTDAFVLDVYDPEDAPFLVAMMIAIDNIHDANTGRY